MSDTTPKKLASENKMTKEPIAVDPAPGQKLDKMSRINFDKVYTVEYTIKVMTVGQISKNSMPKLKGYWKNHSDSGEK